MKKFFLHTAFTLLLTAGSFSASYSQEEDKDTDPFTTEETKDIYELKTINAALRNGKVFISWTATDVTGECVYLVERSTDSINYQAIDVKKGAKSPGILPLMFCYVDEQPMKGKSYYRVKRAGISGTAYTLVVIIENTGKTEKTVSGLASNNK